MMTLKEIHTAALRRAGNVLAWAMSNCTHPDATVEGAAEQITAMYLRELAALGSTDARTVLDNYFPEHRR